MKIFSNSNNEVKLYDVQEGIIWQIVPSFNLGIWAGAGVALFLGINPKAISTAIVSLISDAMAETRKVKKQQLSIFIQFKYL